MAGPTQKKNVSMNQVLAALLDQQSPFPPAYLHSFSDLEGKDLAAFRSVWLQVNPTRRFTLLEDLEELAEADTLVSFDNVARQVLSDPDARVRTMAIRLLWESDDPHLATVFMNMLNEDADSSVRAAAASALGRFIYLGEIEELSEEILHAVEDNLLRVVNSQEDDLVRRRALEALGYSGRAEVPALIRQAYNHEDTDWLATALFAMGRSADKVWEADVKRMLRHPRQNVQLEAVRAAGELELESTRRILLDLLEEEVLDEEVRTAVVWSLSQIGGEEVRERLEELLDETDDDEEIEILENALDNLTFTEDTGMYGLFNFHQLGETTEEIDDIEAYLSAMKKEDIDDAIYPVDNSSGEDSNITKRAGKKHSRKSRKE